MNQERDGMVRLFVIGLMGFAVLVGCSVHHGPTSPNLKVIGSVTDSNSGEPIAGARVADHLYHGSTTQPCQESWTQDDGTYALLTWYEEHCLVASAPGYTPALTTILTKNTETEQEIQMDFQLERIR